MGPSFRCTMIVGLTLVGMLAGNALTLAAEETAVEQILLRLDEAASAYRSNALRFTCDETIIHDPGPGRRVFRFRYIYAYDQEQGGLMDYRMPRLRESSADGKPLSSKKIAKRSRKIELGDHGLPSWISRAYSWIFLFERGRRPHFSFTLEGRDQVADQPALKLAFHPVEPHVPGVNDWVGTAWIHEETFNIMRVEAMLVSEYKSKLRLERDLQAAPDWPKAQERAHAVYQVTTDYGIERDGLRFPTEAMLEAKLYVVRGGRRNEQMVTHPGVVIRQTYDNYRFYGVSSGGQPGRFFNPLDAKPQHY